MASPRRLVAAVLAVLALVAVACGDDPATVEADAPPATTAPSTSIPVEPAADPEVEVDTVLAKSTGAAPDIPALPVPGPLPLDAYEATPEVVLGRLRIPAIGVDEPLQEGMTLTAINRGPSHWPGTAAPGELGNMVVAGHRTTYSKPFYDLDLLEPGDQMLIETPEATHTYELVSTEIVTPDALWISEQTYEYTATTFACHPKGSARYRIVAHWQLVDDTGAPVEGPEIPAGVLPDPGPSASDPGAAVMPGDEV
ncbi:MAG TPA: class E sortase [Acidimicrobiales bacterium]|nr:class E sortase [Acidimicrobiales bacterium]